MYNHYNLQIEMPEETILPSRSLKAIKNLQKKIYKKGKRESRKMIGIEILICFGVLKKTKSSLVTRFRYLVQS